MSAKRIAVVTGGNRGIGLEVARQLAAKGLDVVLTSRDDAAGARAAEEIGARSHALDVANAESVAALASSLDALDVLVNNAGVSLDGFDARASSARRSRSTTSAPRR